MIVTSYFCPDLDGFASAIAYAEFLNKTGRKAEACIIGDPRAEVGVVLKMFSIPMPARINPENQEIILVDASNLDGFPKALDPKKVIELIDHRLINDSKDFPNAKVQIELVGSAATLIAEKFIKDKMPISKNSAILLYTAIISNTLNFKAKVTTIRDTEAAKYLAANFTLPKTLAEEIFRAKSKEIEKDLFTSMEKEMARFVLGRQTIGIIQLELFGALELIEKNLPEIINNLKILKADNRFGVPFDLIFMTSPDLEKNRNIFATADVKAQELLGSVLGIKFQNNLAIYNSFLMRKEIVPKLKDYLEGN